MHTIGMFYLAQVFYYRALQACDYKDRLKRNYKKFKLQKVDEFDFNFYESNFFDVHIANKKN